MRALTLGQAESIDPVPARIQVTPVDATCSRFGRDVTISTVRDG